MCGGYFESLGWEGERVVSSVDWEGESRREMVMKDKVREGSMVKIL